MYFMNITEQMQKAEVLMSQGNTGEAVLLYQTLCRMEHLTATERGLALFGRGACALADEDYVTSTSCLKESWELLFAANGPKNPYTTRTMVLLSRSLLAIGDLDSGMEIGRGALQNLVELYGTEDEQTATAAFFLSAGAYQLNSLLEAENLINLAHNAWEKTFGYESLPVATCLDALGKLRAVCGEKSQALEFYCKALEIKQNILGDHEVTAASIGHVGMVLSDLEEWAEAEEMLGRSLECYQRLGASDDAPGTAAFRERFALCREMKLCKEKKDA